MAAPLLFALLLLPIMVMLPAMVLACGPQEAAPGWRTQPLPRHLHLRPDDVVCYYSNKCNSSNATFGDAMVQTDHILQIEIQEGDWIVLTAEGPAEASAETVAEWKAESRCAESGVENELLWSENLTLYEPLLKAGEHLFTVRTREESSGCETARIVRVMVQSHDCARLPEEDLCSGKGTCRPINASVSYGCTCCPGFVGRYCEERDGCAAGPCHNGGFCVDITEGLAGSTYQCLCPHGFRGQACEEEVNLCERKPCLNNGTCRGNQTSYWCECPAGASGRHCEATAGECVSSPCVHGVCEDGIGGYKCYCLPGYGGDHCEFEYDECDSSPCINGGACEDLVAGYRCHCGPGYQGRRCQGKVDLCEPNPCPPPAHCVDRGNNYSCICHPGYNGPGCTQQYDPCFPNPCQNGGSCWPSLDSFFCSCKPGYTGDTCEELRYPGMPLAHALEDSSVYRSSEPAPLDHLHNLYVAAATLAGACLLVLAAVAACHCRLRRSRRPNTHHHPPPRQVFTEVVWERF